ncbi:MAG: pilus assembly protein [Actinomycetota bacterium]|nr:pilus assembly protein [Actinomycetota bacterium]
MRPALRSPLRARGRGREDGGSVSLELVIIFPLILILLFLGFNYALYYHARNVALAAAQEGLRTARAENGTEALGQQRAYEFLNRTGNNGVLSGVSVVPHRTTTEASITVSGESLDVLPLFKMPRVTQTAVGPVERFTTGP